MATTSRQRPHANDFRPRYPLDPFTNAPLFSSGSRIPQQSTLRPSIDLHSPWLVKSEHLPSQALRRDVILVLGTPSDNSLESFLSSRAISSSLVIIVTHVAPPPLTSSFSPAIRILRLTTPLVVEDNGAVRLVSILEWAERIARIWRAHGAGTSELLEFDEVSMGTMVQAPRMARSSPGTPLGSSTTLDKSSWKGSFLGVKKPKRLSFLSTRRTSSASLGPSPSTLPPIDPTQRPFDAIINYVSDGVAEKLILKQTILVTSITRPFLASTLSPYDKFTLHKKSKKSSSRQPSLYSLPLTPPYHSGESLHPDSSSMTALSSFTSMSPFISGFPSASAHMVHILPQFSRPNLIQSLDSFLSSFSISNVNDDTAHAKQYIMNASTLCDAVALSQDDEQNEWTVADLIFSGSLDVTRGKSWIGSGQDVLLLPSGSSSFSSIPSLSSGTSKLPAGRSINDHLLPTAPRAKLGPIVTVTLGESSVRTVADLTPPPSPRSRTRTKSVPSKPPSPTAATPRPKKNASLNRPHSDATSSPHAAKSPTTPSPENHRSYSKRRLSVPPPLPPKDAPQPPKSSIPMLAGLTTSKTMRRSRLNNVMDVDHDNNPARSFPTPPESEDSTDSGRGSDKQVHKSRSKWIFWKAR